MVESEYYFRNGTYTTLKSILEVLSLLRLVIPSLNLFFEEEILAMLNVSLDLTMLPWVVFIWIMGVQLKRLSLPKWMPPKPVILLTASFIICALFAWAKNGEVVGMAQVVNILVSGLTNGALIGFVSLCGYDVIHDFAKYQLKAIKQYIADFKAKRSEKKAIEEVAEDNKGEQK